MFAGVVYLTLDPGAPDAVASLVRSDARTAPDKGFFCERYSDAAACAAHPETAPFSNFDNTAQTMLKHTSVRAFAEGQT